MEVIAVDIPFTFLLLLTCVAAITLIVLVWLGLENSTIKAKGVPRLDKNTPGEKIKNSDWD